MRRPRGSGRRWDRAGKPDIGGVGRHPDAAPSLLAGGRFGADSARSVGDRAAAAIPGRCPRVELAGPAGPFRAVDDTGLVRAGVNHVRQIARADGCRGRRWRVEGAPRPAGRATRGWRRPLQPRSEPMKATRVRSPVGARGARFRQPSAGAPARRAGKGPAQRRGRTWLWARRPGLRARRGHPTRRAGIRTTRHPRRECGGSRPCSAAGHAGVPAEAPPGCSAHGCPPGCSAHGRSGRGTQPLHVPAAGEQLSAVHGRLAREQRMRRGRASRRRPPGRRRRGRPDRRWQGGAPTRPA